MAGKTTKPKTHDVQSEIKKIMAIRTLVNGGIFDDEELRNLHAAAAQLYWLLDYQVNGPPSW